MLDVEPPETPIHGTRDFFVHLFTITVGLLIALALEGSVGAMEHHHLRLEAEANLRQEIRDNGNLVDQIEAGRVQQVQQLTHLIDVLGLGAQSKLGPGGNISIGFGEEDLSDANWKSASSTGAVGYMDYGTVARFASAYEAQTLYMNLEREIVDSYVGLDSYFNYQFDPNKVSAETAASAQRDARRTIAEIQALHEIGKSVKALYAEALR